MESFQSFSFAISNQTRIKIYEMCLEKPLNITEIKHKLRLSYKSTLNHIRILLEAQLIKKTIEITKKGKVSLIKSIIPDEKFLKDVLFHILKEKNKKIGKDWEKLKPKVNKVINKTIKETLKKRDV